MAEYKNEPNENPWGGNKNKVRNLDVGYKWAENLTNIKNKIQMAITHRGK